MEKWFVQATRGVVARIELRDKRNGIRQTRNVRGDWD